MSSLYLLIHDLTTTSLNNIQRDAKISVIYGIILHYYFLIQG